MELDFTEELTFSHKFHMEEKITDTLKVQNLVNFKECNILEVSDQYIAQQCNCVTSNYKGLSKAIVQKFPWADFYKISYRIPGQIAVAGNEKNNQRYVIGMYAQKYPGPAKWSNDTTEKRIQWFQECLEQIAQIPNIKCIAFPYNIGCGLAGSDWNVYLEMIKKFAEKNKHIIVNICKI